MIIGVSCGEPATNLNCAVARSLFCIVLRLCRLICQGDGALCRPDMRYTSAFLIPIFAVVIAEPSEEPVYTEELNHSSAVASLFSRLFIS